MANTDISAPVAAAQSQASRRDRSPNFPAIGLGRALERAQQLYNRARRYDVRLADAATAWSVKPTSSSTVQLTAALLAFGLVEDSGSGDARKIKISDLGWRILEDQRPGVRERGLAEAALKPKLIADYAANWKNGRPDDTICISELKIDRGFTDDAAARFLRVFDETIQFATATPPDTITDSGMASEGQQPRIPLKLPAETPMAASAVKVGDYVQWTSGGVDQFRVPSKVVGTFPDGHHVQVFGSNTGIPMDELTVVDAPAPTPAANLAGAGNQNPEMNKQRVEANSAWAQGGNDVSVLQRGNRLQITADVDIEGIETLKGMLDDYASILRRLAGKKSN